MKNVVKSLPVKTLVMVALLASCSQPDVAPNRPKDQVPENTAQSSANSDRTTLFGKDCNTSGPHYNLNVWLLGSKIGHVGFVAFRQYENETQLIHLDTHVMGLEPNTSYQLQRAVDTTLDGNCTSSSWLTLGKGLDPQSIVTDQYGFGHEALYRSVASIPVGSTFDIHFQIIKESTGEVVLTSDCYQYTVH